MGAPLLARELPRVRGALHLQSANGPHAAPWRQRHASGANKQTLECFKCMLPRNIHDVRVAMRSTCSHVVCFVCFSMLRLYDRYNGFIPPLEHVLLSGPLACQGRVVQSHSRVTHTFNAAPASLLDGSDRSMPPIISNAFEVALRLLAPSDHPDNASHLHMLRKYVRSESRRLLAATVRLNAPPADVLIHVMKQTIQKQTWNRVSLKYQGASPCETPPPSQAPVITLQRKLIHEVLERAAVLSLIEPSILGHLVQHLSEVVGERNLQREGFNHILLVLPMPDYRNRNLLTRTSLGATPVS
eukprot:1282788-Pyramimonas_sp.AAC.1